MTENIAIGLGLGSVSGLSLILAEVVVSGSTQVPLKEAVAIGAAVVGVVWFFGKKFQSIDDKLISLDEKLNGLWCVRRKILPKDACKPEDESN